MATFAQTILFPFQGRTRSRGYYNRYHNHTVWYKESASVMKVPIKGNELEIPIFTLNKFIDWEKDNYSEDVSTMMVSLFHADVGVGYSTFESNFKHLLQYYYADYRLSTIMAKDKNNNVPYFMCSGAVFTEDMEPCMLNTVKLTMDSNRKITAWEPVLRLSPICWSLNDTMSRMLIGKYLREIIQSPEVYCGFDYRLPYRKIKVEIGDIPFEIISPRAPSILTTNQELLQTAIDHIDEIDL